MIVQQLGRVPAILLIPLLLTSFSSAQEMVPFRSDDPLQSDPDQLPIPQPQPLEISQIYDFLENTFTHRVDPDEPLLRARNINTLGEVPDSSWFTNRMSLRTLSLEELVRGPNQLEGPDRYSPWSVIAMKSQGITPGFTIRDGRGDVYFIKFDPPAHPQLATATEVIATKFFHAFGYNVPENYLVQIQPSDLIISPEARLKDTEGKERALQASDLEEIFSKAYRFPDGSTPVVASRLLPGIPLGPFSFFGQRSDDGNDIFPHQDRRELRGLRVFSAWMNHDDSRSINSLDMYVGEPDRGYVKHHLIDFGSCFGSGSIRVQGRRAGNEYIFEPKPILKAGLSLGLWDRPWRHVTYPDYPGVGRFEADFFQPERWKPEYPNPAFERMRPDDALWATRTVMRFSDEMIRALVNTGRLSDEASREYLVGTLIRRRDKIVLHYLSQISPLNDFKLTGSEGAGWLLTFENLGDSAGLSRSTSYRYRWFSFDNTTTSTAALAPGGTAAESEIPVPNGDPAFMMVRIVTLSPDQPKWKQPVEVVLRMNSTPPTVVGIRRTP